MSAQHRRPATGDLARGFSEILAGEVLERLAQLDLVAAGERRSEAEVARIRGYMRQAIRMWRRLLEQHGADDDGRCPRCRSWWGRRRRWPCPVWNVAHVSLMTDDSPATRGRRAVSRAEAASTAPLPSAPSRNPMTIKAPPLGGTDACC
ncbi:MAG: hypothetical protein ACRDT0_12375 [Pseudonocardiaceae bacterium]